METLTQFGVALILASITEWFVERYFGRPLEENLPTLRRWWLIYVALAIGAALSLWFGVNVICWSGAPESAGRILTAILVGSGTEVLHKVMEKVREFVGELRG